MVIKKSDNGKHWKSFNIFLVVNRKCFFIGFNGMVDVDIVVMDERTVEEVLFLEHILFSIFCGEEFLDCWKHDITARTGILAVMKKNDT